MYMRKERERLGLDISHLVLLIMDLFRGEITTTFRNFQTSDDIHISKVPENITNLHHPLDLMVCQTYFKAPKDNNITLNPSILEQLQAKLMI